jgi:hypothetical protein
MGDDHQPSTIPTNNTTPTMMQAQLPQTLPSSIRTAPSKSSKKAAKSAKKQAKQQHGPALINRTAMSGAHVLFQGTTRDWAAAVLGLALRHDVFSSVLQDGWRLLHWLEVRTCYCGVGCNSRSLQGLCST